jgi:N-terminal domain of (some) glycogen debranching enzymes
MPIEIKVGPPGITISQGCTLMVTEQGGVINPHSDEGVYSIDTRFISSYRLFINREPWVLVNSGQLSFYTARFYLTNPKIGTQDGDAEANTIGLTIERSVEKASTKTFTV